jgi:hypothetical protein
VVLAAGTHIEVLRELGLGEDLLAALALDPEPLGYPDPGVLPGRERIFLEPGHAPLPPESAYGSRPPEACQARQGCLGSQRDSEVRNHREVEEKQLEAEKAPSPLPAGRGDGTVKKHRLLW